MAINATPEQVKKLAEEHVAMFKRRVELGEQGHPNIRLKECRGWLAVWQRILDKGGTELTKEEEGEIMDAYYSGEYDHIFKPEG